MLSDPLAREDSPELQDVLDVLDDPDCRNIVKSLDEPSTASEISDCCDIPQSTTYRKLEQLTEASILTQQTALRTDGHHTSRYVLAFEEVKIMLDERQRFEISITRPPQSAEEQLASMWSEVRKET